MSKVKFKHYTVDLTQTLFERAKRSCIATCSAFAEALADYDESEHGELYWEVQDSERGESYTNAGEEMPDDAIDKSIITDKHNNRLKIGDLVVLENKEWEITNIGIINDEAYLELDGEAWEPVLAKVVEISNTCELCRLNPKGKDNLCDECREAQK